MIFAMHESCRQIFMNILTGSSSELIETPDDPNP